MFLALLAWACAAPPPGPSPTPAPSTAPATPAPTARAAPPPGVVEASGRRIVAVGDLHADLDAALATLRIAGVVDAGGHWSGGDTILVQTGDTTDRGPDSHGVMAMLRRLQEESAAAGGQVVALLGNHEIMNLRGDWRYVSPEDLAGYGGDAKRQAAFGVDGEDGRWLRTLGVAARVGDTVFVHGGITPRWAEGGVDRLNQQVRAALDDPGKPAVLGEDGPVWYRDYVLQPEEQACPVLTQALTSLGARRMVVGHTTRRDGRVESRCGGALLVIDIGVSAHYGSHLGAIELRQGTDAWADYPEGPVDLPDPT
ncbi:MAG: metallophosphoesterase [Alphaproteobacteria bacterium]|nr:metallophosphoesterase [Alphaproteobacteria bacterium]MCB9698067.1 metallophosphoesterase [Alphaproteobacteria bacterium]